MKNRIVPILTFLLVGSLSWASRDDAAHSAVAASHERARALGESLAQEDFTTAITRIYMLSAGIDFDNLTLSQMPVLLEQMQTKLLTKFQEIEKSIQSADTATAQRQSALNLLADELAAVRHALAEYQWIQPRRNFAVDLLPQLLKEIQAEVSAKCQTGRTIPDDLPMEFEQGLDFKCEFYFGSVNESDVRGKKTEPEVKEAPNKRKPQKIQQVQGLVCSGSPSGMDSLSSGAVWVQRAAGDLGALGIGVTSVSLILSGLSALDTKAEYDRANREIVRGNQIRFEGAPTSVNVMDSYRQHCSKSVELFSELAKRIQHKLDTAQTKEATVQAQQTPIEIKSAVPVKADGTVEWMKLSKEQLLTLAEAQILIAVSEAPQHNISTEAKRGFVELRNTVVSLEKRLIALLRLADTVSARDISTLEDVTKDLRAEKEILELQSLFFRLSADCIKALFHRELLPSVRAQIAQAKVGAKALRLKHYKDMRSHRMESAIAELERIASR